MVDLLATPAPGADVVVRRSRWKAVLAAFVVVLAAASLVFEQSPANEVLRTNAALRAVEDGGGPVAVGLVVGAITVGIELTSAVLITLGLHAEEGYVQWLKHKLIDRGRRADERDRRPGRRRGSRAMSRFGADVAIALGLGAGLVTMRHHITDPRPSIRRDLAVSVRATAIVAVVSGLIGYLAAGGLANAEKAGLATPAQWVVDYGTDTRFWVAVLVVGYTVAFAAKLVTKGARWASAPREGPTAMCDEPAAVAAAFESYVAQLTTTTATTTPATIPVAAEVSTNDA